MKDDEIYFRESGTEDTNFILNSWLRSYRYACHGAMTEKVYFSGQEKVIRKILNDSKIYIASNPKDLDQILGYIVFEDTNPKMGIIHYLYVKYPFRRLGIGSGLIKLAADHKDFNICSHMSDAFIVLLEKYDILYNPYILHSR